MSTSQVGRVGSFEGLPTSFAHDPTSACPTSLQFSFVGRSISLSLLFPCCLLDEVSFRRFDSSLELIGNLLQFHQCYTSFFWFLTPFPLRRLLSQFRHTPQKMVNELNYTTISLVIDSWEQLRRVKNYEEVAGSMLFQGLFDKCPQAKVLFGFPIDIDPKSHELITSKRFLMHASYLIQMLDTALNMLGPDIELLTEIMLELGIKHVRYGVKPEYFPVMGEALIATLEETLQHELADNVKEAWNETYKALSSDMIRAMTKESSRRTSK